MSHDHAPIAAVRAARPIDRLWQLGAGALAALAYRTLFASAVLLPTSHQFESWLFRPTQLPTVFVLGVAAWLVWRRRTALHGAELRSDRAISAALAALGTALYLWALLTRSPDLLLPSLAANLLAFASAAWGRAGARAFVLPALVLVLGMPIPAPLRAEIVWNLQLGTASGAAWLLGQTGRELIREGVILSRPDHSFHVIDGCSGLQGIATLILVAILVGELLLLSWRRRSLLVAAALPLGYALNVVRIAYIAASPNPEVYAGLQGDHTPQGLAVLAGGTAVLYGLGRAIADRQPHAAGSPRGPRAALSAPSRFAAVGFAVLAGLSVALPPFPPRAGGSPQDSLSFPSARAGWTSEPLVADPFFLPPMPGTPMLYRRYQLGDDRDPLHAVELLIGIEAPDPSQPNDLLSSKLAWPGPDWNLERRSRARLWDLGREADFAIGARAIGSERAVIYTWRVHDRGFLRECWRSLLALESSPLRRERRRSFVRLVAFSGFDQQQLLDTARQRLDDFITAFRGELDAL